MIYKEEPKENNYQPIPAGSYAARCYKIIYLGTQKVEYMGEVKYQKKMKLVWELPTEKKVFKQGEPEMPFSVSKTYTISLYDKALLRKDLASWRGNDFTEEDIRAGVDFDKLIGVSCLLSITHKETKDKKVYPIVSSISKLPKGMECPPQINKSFIFNIMSYSKEDFESLNKYDQEKVKMAGEYGGIPTGTKSGNTPVHFDESELNDETVPF